jgi:hypothetical protein
MIYKNKYGTIVVQFGTGDIEIANGRILSNTEKEMFPCCVFVAHKKHGKIGEYTYPKNNNPARERDHVDVSFVFTDPRSVDVLIESLLDVKKRFQQNGTKILTPQEITDEV